MRHNHRTIGHGRRERGGGRWEQHGAPLDAFSRLACHLEMELATRSGQRVSILLSPSCHRSSVTLGLCSYISHLILSRVSPSHWDTRLEREPSPVTPETTHVSRVRRPPPSEQISRPQYRDFTPCIQPAGLLCRTGGATCPSDCDTQSLTQRRADSMSVNTRAGWTGDRLRTANAKLLRHSTPPDMIKATQRTRPAPRPRCHSRRPEPRGHPAKSRGHGASRAPSRSSPGVLGWLFRRRRTLRRKRRPCSAPDSVGSASRAKRPASGIPCKADRIRFCHSSAQGSRDCRENGHCCIPPCF